MERQLKAGFVEVRINGLRFDHRRGHQGARGAKAGALQTGLHSPEGCIRLKRTRKRLLIV